MHPPHPPWIRHCTSYFIFRIKELRSQNETINYAYCDVIESKRLVDCVGFATDVTISCNHKHSDLKQREKKVKYFLMDLGFLQPIVEPDVRSFMSARCT